MKSNRRIERAKVLCSESVAPKTNFKTKFQTELRFCNRRKPRENVVFRVSSRVPLTRDFPKCSPKLARRLTERQSLSFFKEWLTKSIIFLTFTERSRVIWRTFAREACNCFTASSSIVTRIGMTETLMWYRCGYITVFNIRKSLVVFRHEVGLPTKGKKYWNNACVALWYLLPGGCAFKYCNWPNKRPGRLFNFWGPSGDV